MAIENETKLLKYENDERYLSPKNIAMLMQDMLNKASGSQLFKVYTDMNVEPTPNIPYVCTLKTTLMPFSLRGVSCETITIRLTAKIPVETEKHRNFAINALNKVIGAVSGNFNVMEGNENITYNFFSNFRLNEPTTMENINSAFIGNYILEGTMNVTKADGGLISDAVKTYVVVDNTIDGVIASGEYRIYPRGDESAVTYAMNNPVKVGSFLPTNEYTAVSHTKTIQFIYQNNSISKLFRDYILGRLANNENPFLNSEGKPSIKILTQFPDEAVVMEYNIISATMITEAGSYVAFNLTVQVKP